MNLKMDLNEKLQRGEISFDDFIQNEINDFNDKDIISKHMEVYGRYSFENKEIENGNLFIGTESEYGPYKTIMFYTIKNMNNTFISIELYTQDISKNLTEYKIEILNRDDIRGYLEDIEKDKEKYMKDTFEGFREEVERYEDNTEDVGERFKYNVSYNRNGEDVLAYRSERVVNLVLRSINSRFKNYRFKQLVIRDMKEKEKDYTNRGVDIRLEFINECMYLYMGDNIVNLTEEEFYKIHSRGGTTYPSNENIIRYIMNLYENNYTLKEVGKEKSLIEKEGETYYIEHKYIFNDSSFNKENIIKENEVDYITEHLENQEEGQLNLLGLL